MTTRQMILEHAKQNTLGTSDGWEMLQLEHDDKNNYAANFYLSALDLIRDLQKEVRKWKYRNRRAKVKHEK